MRNKAIRWLYGELPGLVENGVLPADAGERLRAHYGPLPAAQPLRQAVVIFGILGALLIGGGIILMLAHNWEDLSRPMRACLSFLPLAMAQGLTAWVLLRRAQSAAWREGAATVQFLMIGASISLVAQTYNISGDLPRFLLTWSLLGLPLAYLLNAVVPALLYLWGVTEWACHIRFEDGFAAGYWLLAALLLPLLVGWLRRDRHHVRPTVLLWAACVSVTVCAGVTIERVLPGLWIIVYGGLFAFLFLAGEFWFAGGDGFWGRPLRHFGAGGVLALSFLLTFEWPWESLGYHYWQWERLHEHMWRMVPDIVLGGVLPVVAVALLVATVRRKLPMGFVFGILPVLATLAFALANVLESSALAAGLFDAYLLFAGIWLVGMGLRANQQGQMNVGMLVLAALIIARFFDSDLSFILRGLAFIGLGIAFLVSNLVILRRKGAPHE